MTMRFGNSLFVHIPRTGGVWFREVARMLMLDSHILIGDLDSHLTWEEMPAHWKHLRAFSFVRHPLAWVKSRWSHSIEHDTFCKQTFFGIHREFDALVERPLADTLINIMRRRPGIVGETYRRMLAGSNAILRRTEDLPGAAFDLLHALEGLPKCFRPVVEWIPAKNTSAQANWCTDEIAALPQSLAEEFTASEADAVRVWEGANP